MQENVYDCVDGELNSIYVYKRERGNELPEHKIERYFTIDFNAHQRISCVRFSIDIVKIKTTALVKMAKFGNRNQIIE